MAEKAGTCCCAACVSFQRRHCSCYAQQSSNNLGCCLLQVIEPLFSLKVSSVTNEGTFKNNEFVGQRGLHAQLRLDDRQCFCQAPAPPGHGNLCTPVHCKQAFNLPAASAEGPGGWRSVPSSLAAQLACNSQGGRSQQPALKQAAVLPGTLLTLP